MGRALIPRKDYLLSDEMDSWLTDGSVEWDLRLYPDYQAQREAAILTLRAYIPAMNQSRI